MVERFHRQLKASPSAANIPQWTEALPLVLLGIRNALKVDAGCTPAELVYGTTLCLPGESVSPSTFKHVSDRASYVTRLTNAMRSVRPSLVRPQTTDVFVHPSLQKTSRVFIRHDAVRRPLEPSCDGPFKVIKRHEKFYIIERDGREDTVSIDRLKPAYFDCNPIISDVSAGYSLPTDSPIIEILDDVPGNAQLQQRSAQQKTRSGQTDRFPECLK
ncbi:unnamed protein product [Heterobilharzia americana]|nr:unnamed protein product [Heterobilharzia americana]